ncbi:hypothetical protein NM688_g1355 [Phlebia brevispora]|uniref:Uncharacterized protein n=1 Tax=Phlebia brevispora TaxID=194682 RepID=A0ACC1TC23_9APHY|nr:hypothetical protein NM688_g1355 [Phlebia brevispora]
MLDTQPVLTFLLCGASAMAHVLASFRQTRFLPQLTRSVVNRAALRPVPPPKGKIATPEDFLKAIGRETDTKVTAESWEALWKLDGQALKKAGLAVNDRRYILWSIEKYRQGHEPAEFAHRTKSKKKIRGWGPSVQNGKQNRSKRHKV